jgi:hypothetical protein
VPGEDAAQGELAAEVMLDETDVIGPARVGTGPGAGVRERVGGAVLASIANDDEVELGRGFFSGHLLASPVGSGENS